MSVLTQNTEKIKLLKAMYDLQQSINFYCILDFKKVEDLKRKQRIIRDKYEKIIDS